ncbi:MAG: uncharacterized protein A8A55_1559 [Amphiamblys sp. WSBS2006]|nr:MAG: uncharacterized protein A8A55_1559 [Amphiamblys sp. WSBS2006]
MICSFCGTTTIIENDDDYAVCVNGHILYETQRMEQSYEECMVMKKATKVPRVRTKKPEQKKASKKITHRAQPYVTLINTQYILCLSIRKLAERGYTDRLLEQNAKHVWKAFLSRLPEMRQTDKSISLREPEKIHERMKKIRREEDEKGNDTDVFVTPKLSAVICKDRTVFFTFKEKFFNIDIAFHVLFIALNITQYPVSLVDLYRMIRDGTLPYYECEKYFPQCHIKRHPFQLDKIRSKTYSISPQKLNKRFIAFVKFLTPQEIPPEFFLCERMCEKLLARLCSDFNVDRLAGLIRDVFSATAAPLHVAGTQNGHSTLAYLAAYVITTIRMVCGPGLEPLMKTTRKYKKSFPLLYSKRQMEKLDDSLAKRATEEGWDPDLLFIEKDDDSLPTENIFSDFFKKMSWWNEIPNMDKKTLMKELGECMRLFSRKKQRCGFKKYKKKPEKAGSGFLCFTTGRLVKKEPFLFRLVSYASLVTGTKIKYILRAMADVEYRVFHHASFHKEDCGAGR